jgi:hypothetical protein
MSKEERAENRAEAKRIRHELGLGLFDNVGGMNQGTLTLVKHYAGGNFTGPEGAFRHDAQKLANHGWSVASQSQSQRSGRTHLTVTYVRPNTFSAQPEPSWYIHPSRQVIAADAHANIACYSCKARFEATASQTSYTCPGCAAQVDMRLCPGCFTVIHIPHAIAGKPIKCKSCGTDRPWAKWDERPVTAAQYAERFPPPAPQNIAASTPSSPVNTTSIADELTKLAQLRDSGILSDSEFASAKARLLGSL